MTNDLCLIRENLEGMFIWGKRFYSTYLVSVIFVWIKCVKCTKALFHSFILSISEQQLQSFIKYSNFFKSGCRHLRLLGWLSKQKNCKVNRFFSKQNLQPNGFFEIMCRFIWREEYRLAIHFLTLLGSFGWSAWAINSFM